MDYQRRKIQLLRAANKGQRTKSSNQVLMVQKQKMGHSRVTLLAKTKIELAKTKLGLLRPRARPLEVPAAPAGASTARRASDPRHAEVVRALVNVKQLDTLTSTPGGELVQYHKKLQDTVARGLGASSGSAYFRAWQRWTDWRKEQLGAGALEESATAVEAACYLLYLAYTTGGVSSVRNAKTALTYYSG